MTAGQIDQFRSSIKQGCIASGQQRGDRSAEAFCNCMDKVLRENLSNDDFDEMAKEAAVSKAAGKGAGDMPVMQKLFPKLEACKRANGA